jgi:hypothetical protein
VDVLLEGVEVEQGQDLVPSVVGPVGGEDLLFDRASISVKKVICLLVIYNKYGNMVQCLFFNVYVYLEHFCETITTVGGPQIRKVTN